MAKIQVCLALLAALITTICAVSLNSQAMENYNDLKQNRALTFLGAVEGKSYFMENATMTWTSARTNCTAYGLVSATIQTTAQRDLLRSKFNLTGSGYFWIAGRDIQTIDQFVWDKDGSIESNVLTLYTTPSLCTCISYYIISATSSYYYPRPCTTSLPFLCQTD